MPNTSPLEFHDGFRRQLVEIVSVQIGRMDTIDGKRFGDKAKEKVIAFYDCITRLAAQESASWYSAQYDRLITVQPGEIRKSYREIGNQMMKRYGADWTDRTVIRYVRTLETIGLLKRTHEAKYSTRTTKGWASPQRLKQLASYDFKILMLDFTPLEEYYERFSIDPMLEAINNAPEYDPCPQEPGYMEALQNDQLEPVFENEFDDSAFQNEIGEEISVNQYSSNLLATNCLTDSSADSGDATAGQNLLPKENAVLIVPPTGDDWRVQVCDGGVDRKREVKSLAELPDKPKGEYYATWIAERMGLYWTPWIVWDLDCKDDLERARGWAIALVAKLLRLVPAEALRVVFSTNKGFHVKLDSRCVDLKPSKNLHQQLREFCFALEPNCDLSLYSMNRVLGLPNSKHRSTGWRYANVPLKMLKGIIADIMMLTARQQDPMPPAKELAPVPALIEAFERATFKVSPQVTGRFPAFSKLQQIAHDPLPEFRGVTEGGRDQAAFRLANYYKRMSLSQWEATVLCMDANKRNQPPLSESTVRDKVQRAYQNSTIKEFSK